MFCLSGGESISNCRVFFSSLFLSLMTLNGTGLPNSVDSADWRFLVDFRCGTVGIVGGVCF